MNEAQLREYDALRQEILQSDRITLEVTSVAFAATGLILAQGISAKDPFICVIPLPLLAVAYVYAASKRFVVWTIACYCRKYLEPATGIRWETRLLNLRSKHRRMEGSRYSWIRTLLAEYLMFMLMGTGSAAASITLGQLKKMDAAFYLLPAFLLFGLLAIGTRVYMDLESGGRVGSRTDKRWPSASPCAWPIYPPPSMRSKGPRPIPNRTATSRLSAGPCLADRASLARIGYRG